MIELKYKKAFYGQDGTITDRNNMQINQLDIRYRYWMHKYLKMTNGLIEFTIPQTGIYRIHQQSRNSNCQGPSRGVNIQFKMEMEKVKNINI